MPLRLLRQSNRRRQRPTCVLHLWIGCSLLLAGCSRTEYPELDMKMRELLGTENSVSDEWNVDGSTEQLPAREVRNAPIASHQPVKPSQFWQFSGDTHLRSLPEIVGAEDADVELAFPRCETEKNETAPARPTLGVLLPPRKQTESRVVTDEETIVEDLVEVEEEKTEVVTSAVTRKISVPDFHELSAEERRLLDLIKRETLKATTGASTDSKLDEECREKISVAYGLSRRGAAYAARQKLIMVLRQVSQAKDTREHNRIHSDSLAAGLRALEEAEDFVPRGAQLEAEMKLDVTCAAHRTPISRQFNLANAIPEEMLERYNRYAQIKLAVAVAGEPAGSMALYALGMLNSQLAATELDQHPLAVRQAIAFQQAALLAHNENYLAAHELGVLLAETGHFAEANHLLSQVVQQRPNAVGYRNLARVQKELGRDAEAQTSLATAHRLNRQGSGPRPQVAWVSPQEFSRGSQMNTFTTTQTPQVASRPAPPTQHTSMPVWR